MIWRRVQITKPLIIQFLPACCYFLAVRTRHSSCTLYVRAFVINGLFWRGSESVIWKWLHFGRSAFVKAPFVIVLRLLNTAGCITAFFLKKGLGHWPVCWGGGFSESCRSQRSVQLLLDLRLSQRSFWTLVIFSLYCSCRSLLALACKLRTQLNVIQRFITQFIEVLVSLSFVV